MKALTLLSSLLILLSLAVSGAIAADLAAGGDDAVDAVVSRLQAVQLRLELQLRDVALDEGVEPRALAGELGQSAQELRALRVAIAAASAEPAAEAFGVVVDGARAVAGAVRHACRARAADAAVQQALDELRAAADDLLPPLSDGLLPPDKKTIPLRFVEVHDCAIGSAGCDPYMDREALLAGQDAMNEAYASARLRFWVKAIDRYEMDQFASTTAPMDLPMPWSVAKDELGRAVRVWDTYPLPTPRTYQEWVDYVTTAYADRTELLVWLFDSDSAVKRATSGKSYAQFPQGGRAAVLSWGNLHFPGTWPDVSPNHLVHELGHFFGLGHTWEGPCCTHPERQQPMDWADLWDLTWCPGELGFPQFFSSREAALASGCAQFFPIETTLCPCGQYDNDGKCTCEEQSCRVDNRNGSGDSVMVCTINGEEFRSGEPILKGLSFPTGDAENPPASPQTYWDPWSFAWGVNAMNYYSRFNAHLWVPGRFSASQIDLVRGHTTTNVPIVVDYAPFTNLESDRKLLGVDVKDYLWWSNGDFTFSRELSPILDDDRVPITGDFDADGADDIFWYRPGTAPDAIWWSGGDRTWHGASMTVNGYYTPVAGDFDGDGATDILWYRPGPSSDPVWWFLPAARKYVSGTLSIDGNYIPVVGNFDAQHGDDIAWYDPIGGEINFWWSDGDRTFTHQDHVPAGAGFTPVAGDFDGDERVDIFWYAPGRATDIMWWSKGASRAFLADRGRDLQFSGYARPIVGDFDGDGRDDILWDASRSISDTRWSGRHDRTFDKARFAAWDDFTPAVGTFDRDPARDIFWYHR